MGVLKAVLEASWRVLEASWRCLGSSWGHLGRVLRKMSREKVEGTPLFGKVLGTKMEAKIVFEKQLDFRGTFKHSFRDFSCF